MCAWACGSNPGDGGGSGGDGSSGEGGSVGNGGPVLHGNAGSGFEFPTDGGSGGSTGTEAPAEQNLIALRIEPANAALVVAMG